MSVILAVGEAYGRVVGHVPGWGCNGVAARLIRGSPKFARELQPQRAASLAVAGFEEALELAVLQFEQTLSWLARS